MGTAALAIPRRPPGMQPSTPARYGSMTALSLAIADPDVSPKRIVQEIDDDAISESPIVRALEDLRIYSGVDYWFQDNGSSQPLPGTAVRFLPPTVYTDDPQRVTTALARVPNVIVRQLAPRAG